MRITMLGCGASTGVPVIGCDCAVCRSDNPKNKRTRVSVHIEHEGTCLLIDSSPDLRQQALSCGITRVDAILYTHDHADHTHGIDDLRPFNHRKNAPLDAYGTTETLNGLKERFGYAFQPPIPEYGWFRPCLTQHEISDNEWIIQIGAMAVQPFAQQHGRRVSLGVRVGPFAYTTDANHLSEEAFETLAGVEVWIVDCLRVRPSPTHANLETTLRWVERVKPRLAVLTHMSHELEYEELKLTLPSGITPGYDGFALDL